MPVVLRVIIGNLIIVVPVIKPLSVGHYLPFSWTFDFCIVHVSKFNGQVLVGKYRFVSFVYSV